MIQSKAMLAAREKAVARKARVVFPEAEDPRVAEAMDRLRSDGLADPVGLSDPTEGQAAAIVANRGMKPAMAERMLAKPLIRGAAMVAAGEADVMIAGADSPTRRVIEAAGLALGLADGVTAPSSFFLMVLPDGREFVFADCAVNTDPDADGLANIARLADAAGAALFGEARTAMLSFSTGTSGAGPSVDRVRAATEATGFAGPVQADAALNAAIGAKKGFDGGAFNTLVFPSLDAGNIGYKLVQELAGAQAIGPILQGFRKPICDLSRGATPDDIVDATVLTLALG